MASRRPDSFDGLGFSGRDDPLYGSGYPPRSADPQHLHWVTTPPDIPGSRNLHTDDRNPVYDDPRSEHGGPGFGGGFEAPLPGGVPADQLNKFVGFGIGLVSLFTENVLAHPYIVFRRQCQVNFHGRCYHLTPFSAVAVMYSIAKTQGIRSQWKGMGSTFIVHAVTLGAEGVISELTPFPREFPHRWSVKQVAGHFLLKGMSAMVALPFYCSSLIETVQSEIVRDESASGLLDCVREGVLRLLGVGAPHSRRLLPLSCLLLPVALHALLRYSVSACVQRGALWLHQWRQQRGAQNKPPAQELGPLDVYFPELAAAWLGALVADVVAFPLETALHRLALQGTRTIIDATDGVVAAGNGGSPLVLPVNTQYDGFSDCLTSIRRKEGVAGLYRGLGAMAAQYTVHATLLGAAHALLRLLLQGGAGGFKETAPVY